MIFGFDTEILVCAEATGPPAAPDALEVWSVLVIKAAVRPTPPAFSSAP
jgi:hypothetical protein